MILWAVLTVLVAVVAVAVAVPLVRRHDMDAGEAPALAVIRDQLREVDAAEAAGDMEPAAADALRIELKRRLLAESGGAPATRPLGAATLGRLAVGAAAVVAVAATALYAGLGSPELATQAAPEPEPGLDFADIARRIEARLAEQPDDAEGWRALGIAYSQLGRFTEAAGAFGRAAALTPGRADVLSAQGEALVLAAGGTVPPQAAELFARARAIDPADVRARYFGALASAQAGDRGAALSQAKALLADTPPDAPWLPQLRALTASLSGSTSAPGPTAAEVEAAQALAPQEQQAMIAGMVDRLAQRLRASPKDPEGWKRLMRARMVMGDPSAAAEAHREALAALQDAPEARATITEEARALGVPGA